MSPTGQTTLVIHGTPVGQGRLSHIGGGRLIHSNGKRLKVWRDAVKYAATRNFEQPLTGPVGIEITVTVAKPASAPKRRRTWPITRSSQDWDHHARAISDAMTGAAYVDDSQIIEGTVRKCYPGEAPDSLQGPGAVIRVWSLGGAA